MILLLYSAGLAELYYLFPRYGIEWFLAGIGVTALLGGVWMRSYWD